MIPGLGRFGGEGIGYPLQYSWASLAAQQVKNLPTVRRPGFDPWGGISSPGQKLISIYKQSTEQVSESRKDLAILWENLSANGYHRL